MNIRYSLQSVSACLPLSRTSLFEELVVLGQHGDIHKVWISPGHLFVALNGGKKLITLDAKCADHLKDEETTGCLDIETEVPVICVLSRPPHAVLIVFEDGCMQCWQYRPDYTWVQVTKVNIQSETGSCITSICLDVSHDSLYWCERSDVTNKPVYSIHKRQIFEGDAKKKELKLGPVTTLLRNCSQCKLYPRGHGVYMVTQSSTVPFSLTIVLYTLTGQIQAVVNEEVVPLLHLNLHTPLQFREVLLGCLSHISKARQKSKVISTVYRPFNQSLLQLYTDGTLVILGFPTDPGKCPVRKTHLDDFSANDVLGLVPLHGCVGVVYTSQIRVYSDSSGALHCTVGCPDGGMVQGVCEVLPGASQAGVYTNQDLCLLQRSTALANPSDQVLMEVSHFQSEAVRLAYIDKMQKYTTCPSVPTLQSLREGAGKKYFNIPSTTKLMDTVEPFLVEYWKLENVLQQGLCTPELMSDIKPPSIADEVEMLLSPRSVTPHQARQSQLLLLAQWYPDDVLAYLLSQLDMGTGELSSQQQARWQCALAKEGVELAGSCDIGVPIFELMCHLLYTRQPAKLMQFLRRAQQVWDQKVGISAFIRRRQALFIYERALKCLPQPDSSVDQDTAVHVHSSVLLISEVDDCILKAIQLFLRFHMWAEAISILQEHRDCHNFILLYQMVMQSLTQNDVFHLHADKIVPLMPSFDSCDIATKGDNPASADEIFCDTDRAVSLDVVRPYLLSCLHQGVTSSND